MSIRTFDPTHIKPDDYRHRYPELERSLEFDSLSARALIFVWWFSNRTSELVMYEHDDYARAAEALKRSGYNPSKAEKDRILGLQFDSQMAIAIKKMASFDPNARFMAYMMIKKIYDQYQFIIDQGPEAFKESTTKGEGDKAVTTEEIDYKKYVDIAAKIANEISGLLAKLEEGFAIVNISGEEVKEDESTALKDWHQQRAGE
jgi:hypothetical protein